MASYELPGDGYIYFQGGPGSNSLYRTLIPTSFPLPAGFRARVQDQYDVPNLGAGNIAAKYNAIQSLLDEASGDTSNTWVFNFTSGASVPWANPNAVAGRINKQVKAHISALGANKQNRLGTIITDFPDDQGNTDYVDLIFNYNSVSPLSAQDWMGSILDGTSLSRLTIPGTHDSCTFEASVSVFSKCQNLTLPQQLAAGIRFIDIRCRQFNDIFQLHHGREYLGMTFDYVLGTCLNFLSQHPKECIVMSVKEEHDPAGNTKTFQDLFTQYITPSLSSWYLGNTIPALGNAIRGKMVLMRRFYIQPGSDSTQWGVDMSAWPGNTTFTRPPA